MPRNHVSLVCMAAFRSLPHAYSGLRLVDVSLVYICMMCVIDAG